MPAQSQHSSLQHTICNCHLTTSGCRCHNWKSLYWTKCRRKIDEGTVVFKGAHLGHGSSWACPECIGSKGINLQGIHWVSYTQYQYWTLERNQDSPQINGRHIGIWLLFANTHTSLTSSQTVSVFWSGQINVCCHCIALQCQLHCFTSPWKFSIHFSLRNSTHRSVTLQCLTSQKLKINKPFRTSKNQCHF